MSCGHEDFLTRHCAHKQMRRCARRPRTAVNLPTKSRNPAGNPAAAAHNRATDSHKRKRQGDERGPGPSRRTGDGRHSQVVACIGSSEVLRTARRHRGENDRQRRQSPPHGGTHTHRGRREVREVLTANLVKTFTPSICFLPAPANQSNKRSRGDVRRSACAVAAAPSSRAVFSRHQRRACEWCGVPRAALPLVATAGGATSRTCLCAHCWSCMCGGWWFVLVC